MSEAEQTDQLPSATEAPGALAELAKEAAMLKAEMAEMELQTKIKKSRFEEITDQILKTLDLLEMESFRAQGFLFYKTVESSVKIPKTVEDKKLLFQFLEEKGIFMEIASVNSQTLNSLYKNLAKEAAKNGNFDFRIPGVEEPTTYNNLKLRKQ